MQVWQDKQIDAVKATKAGIVSRSKAFENIVKTFEMIQEGMKKSLWLENINSAYKGHEQDAIQGK